MMSLVMVHGYYFVFYNIYPCSFFFTDSMEIKGIHCHLAFGMKGITVITEVM